MSLIKCGGCGEEISKNAKSCPKCGEPRKKRGCWIFVLVILLVVVAFIMFLPNTNTETSAEKYERHQSSSITRKGKRLVQAMLKDGDSAKFRNLHVGQNNDGVQALCGEVNSRNSFGGYTGFTRFVTGGEKRVEFEGDSNIFEKLWVMFCRKFPTKNRHNKQ